MNKAYNKITWQNKPSTATPLNQTNLNEMSNALDTIDDRVIALDSGKVGSVTVTNTLPTGDTIATITVDGTAANIKSAQVEVDSTPSATSENPLQNKAIYEMLNNLLPEETVQGNPISISDASGLNAKACSVDLLPIQDLSQGEPSPTNICPISGRTEVNLSVSGKNLLNPSNCVDNLYISTGAMKFATIEGASVFYAYVSPNATYTVSANGGDRTIIVTSDSVPANNVNVKRVIFDSGSLSVPKTFTTQAEETLVCIYLNRYASTKPTQVQLEVGSQATAYEPHQGETVTVQLGQTVYGGTLDVTNGKLTIDKAIVTYVGNEGWYEHSSGRFYVNGKPSGIDISKRGQNDLFKCNTRSYITDQTGYGAYIFYGSSGLYCSKKDANETLSDFTTALGTTNMQVTYPLATPIEITLTAEQISLLKGNNVVSTDGDNINLVYSADIGLYIAGQLQNS